MGMVGLAGGWAGGGGRGKKNSGSVTWKKRMLECEQKETRAAKRFGAREGGEGLGSRASVRGRWTGPGTRRGVRQNRGSTAAWRSPAGCSGGASRGSSECCHRTAT